MIARGGGAAGARDDRGAVLLVGLLACVLLLGATWTVMGIGESIAFRERGQSAADAVALSTSIMQARGMNFLVFMNLIMAALLVIRIALRVLEIGLVVIALPTFFASLAAIPEVEETLATANEFIKPALVGLGMASEAVVMVAPSFAQGTAKYVGANYGPVVTDVTISSDADIVTSEGELAGLPVAVDLTGYDLCSHAINTVFGVLRDIVQGIPVVGGLVSRFLRLIGPIVRHIIGDGSLFFCQIGFNLPQPPVPGLDEVVKDAAEQCEQEHPAPNPYDYPPGSAAYQSAVSAYQQAKTTCINTREGAYNTAVSLVTNSATTALQESIGVDPPMSMGIDPAWTNGRSQILAIATLDPTLLKAGLSLFGAPASAGLPKAAYYAFSQSEFYYDCHGTFGSNDCNGKTGEAMWNFRWRARLVPVDETSKVFRLYSAMTDDYRREIGRSGSPAAIGVYQSIPDYMLH